MATWAACVGNLRWTFPVVSNHFEPNSISFLGAEPWSLQPWYCFKKESAVQNASSKESTSMLVSWWGAVWTYCSLDIVSWYFRKKTPRLSHIQYALAGSVRTMSKNHFLGLARCFSPHCARSMPAGCHRSAAIFPPQKGITPTGLCDTSNVEMWLVKEHSGKAPYYMSSLNKTMPDFQKGNSAFCALCWQMENADWNRKASGRSDQRTKKRRDPQKARAICAGQRPAGFNGTTKTCFNQQNRKWGTNMCMYIYICISFIVIYIRS